MTTLSCEMAKKRLHNPLAEIARIQAGLSFHATHVDFLRPTELRPPRGWLHLLLLQRARDRATQGHPGTSAVDQRPQNQSLCPLSKGAMTLRDKVPDAKHHGIRVTAGDINPSTFTSTRLADALVPGGWWFFGHAERLNGPAADPSAVQCWTLFQRLRTT